MPVALTTMRDLLLPGLLDIRERYAASVYDWRGIYSTYETTPAAPHVWVPKLTIPQAIIVGAAATIIKNPMITRRFWAGWKL